MLGSIDVARDLARGDREGGQFGTGVSLRDALKQTERVRIIEGFSSEIGAVRQFGLTMHEGAAILGEAEVQRDGSWEAQVPPYLPIPPAADRPLRPGDPQPDAVDPGHARREPHLRRLSRVARARRAPRRQGATLAQQLPLADKDFSKIAIADRIELPWYGAVAGSNVQDVFDAKCVSCHDGGARDPFAGRTYTVDGAAGGRGRRRADVRGAVPAADQRRARHATTKNDAVSYPGVVRLAALPVGDDG